VLFSLLLWLARLVLNERFVPHPPQGDLELLVETYIFYALFGLGAPIFYGLALLNQWLMSWVQRRNI